MHYSTMYCDEGSVQKKCNTIQEQCNSTAMAVYCMEYLLSPNPKFALLCELHDCTTALHKEVYSKQSVGHFKFLLQRCDTTHKKTVFQSTFEVHAKCKAKDVSWVAVRRYKYKKQYKFKYNYSED